MMTRQRLCPFVRRGAEEQEGGAEGAKGWGARHQMPLSPLNVLQDLGPRTLPFPISSARTVLLTPAQPALGISTAQLETSVPCLVVPMEESPQRGKT